MNAKSLVIFVFAAFALIIFPISILLHTHLYADGAYLFARMLESGTFDAAAHSQARVGHHFVTQFPVIVANKCGMSNLRHLSYIYGIAQYYLPWCLYLLACMLFLRANMLCHAVLLALMYCMLMCFTCWFINSESHLAVSLFAVTLAVISTGDLRRRADLTILALLWLLSLSCYEFWALYFLASLGLLVLQYTRRQVTLAVLTAFALLYVIGSGVNTYAIMFTRDVANRDNMFGRQFFQVCPQILAVSILFLVFILGTLGSMLLEHTGSQVSSRLKRCVALVLRGVDSSAFLVLVGLASVAGGEAVTFNRFARAKDAYILRSLNLFLPLMFAIFLDSTTGRPIDDRACSFKPPKALLSGLVAILFVTVCAWYHHAAEFRIFKRQVFAATQHNVGYVPLHSALSDQQNYQNYGWPTMYPTLSLLLQSMQGTSIRSVIYNPNATWQPFGPSDTAHAQRFAVRLGVRIENGGLQADNLPEDTARKPAEPQR
ncbi:MAG: hypothetical protein WCP22_00885 [Chlamydiota bacterium]